MYTFQSVKREPGNPGLPIQARDSISLLDVDDIAYMPPRDGGGVAIYEDIVMNPEAYGITLYLTPGTHKITSAADGDTDQVGFQPQIVGNHPGNSLAVREFKHNCLNRRFIIIVRYCSGKPADIIGDLCNPCRMIPSYTGDKDTNSTEFTFQQISKGEDIGMYFGTIPMEEPVAVVDAEATAVTYTADGQYQLSPGEASVTTFEGGRDGSIATLCGTSGKAPVVTGAASISDGAIILRGARPFTASEGSQITLRAFDAGDGKILWIEQSRYERS
ncbi:MAG: hypothetical protein K2H87_05280 [Duncaniella sp.]|nr:hypothetical protein [Duncaniella sp.]